MCLTRNVIKTKMAEGRKYERTHTWKCPKQIISVVIAMFECQTSQFRSQFEMLKRPFVISLPTTFYSIL